MIETEGGSKALRRRAESLFPGGVNSPVRAYGAVGGEQPIIVRGSGATVWDADGRAYLDYVGAFGPLILGHAHPAVVDAVKRATEAGGPFGATTLGEVRLGELVREAMPAIERLRFVSSGTEAAMSAIRVARAATGRSLVLKFEGGYHGHSDGLLARAGSGLATLGLPGSAGVSREVAGETIVAPYNDLKAVETILQAHRGGVAAIIVEPVAANMGVVAPQPGFLAGLREAATRHGTLLIFDEVITGFRVARGGAQQLYGVHPDLVLLGKIIGGGLPVGAYGGRADLLDLVAPVGPVYQAGTLSGHPTVMAAGIATLEALGPESYMALEDTGRTLEAGLLEAARSAGLETSVARVGSLLTVFFRAEPPRSYLEALEADGTAFARFHAAMRRSGVLLPPSPHEAWFISLAHTGEAINRTIEAAAGAFLELGAPPPKPSGHARKLFVA
jgi:glutamate-1-semialdehyde 2,1-aminomutase